MGEVITPPEFVAFIRDLQSQIAELRTRTGRFPPYTLATRPAATAVTPGSPIFVSDAAPGARFQASDGTSWVSLG